ncbi:MAG TPA: CBS domain-containing protein [Amycolatopsis sp.]|uniref:CBS domain-containing protein n=1 Tax=Amycolatopsis sp. TaxID=37632 RepID=UPI002B4AA7FA|nr:CBS domain-containing protein [Amycolatopsis sp.]HKS47899.1 CBS domain-containing protein [Amycolatopsis sp.]
MTSPVVTVTAGTPVKQAVKLLTSHGFTTLPVVDEDDFLVGVVTGADLLDEEPLPGPRIPVAGEGPQPSAPDPPTVGELMTRDVPTASGETPVPTLTRLLLETRVRAVPVVDAGRVTGIVTRRDLLRLIVGQDEAITHRRR